MSPRDDGPVAMRPSLRNGVVPPFIGVSHAAPAGRGKAAAVAGNGRGSLSQDHMNALPLLLSCRAV